MGAKKKVETAKSMLDKLTLNTGLAVTPPGPATTKRVMKRGRNTLAGGTGLAAGAGVLAATGPDRSDRSKRLDSTVADMKAKRAEAKKAREAKEVERKKKNAATKESNTKRRNSSKGGTAPGIMTKDSGMTKRKGGTAPGIMTKDSGVAGKSAAKTEKFGVGDKFVIRGNKANVTDTQLKKTGLTQAQYMKQWRASNKRPTAASASKSTTKSTTTKTPKKVGGIRKFLLGADGKFGGARGAIDFLPGKSRKKKEDKPVKKNMGGMMKSKMASKGGAMKKKGYAMGGAVMKKKGYAKGGAVRSKMASKGGASRKPRGVGAATRGYGKAMR
mgnify:CR=1 FL=1